jgi:MFS family permease
MAPIPHRFLIPLILCRFALGISWIVIHPYVSDQVASFGVPAASLGFWVGIIESCLQLAEIFAPILCYISDYTGRKPIFILSMLLYGWVLIPIGFSTSLFGVFFWRTVQGFCSVYAILTKAIMAEVTDHSNRGRGQEIPNNPLLSSFADHQSLSMIAFGMMFLAFAVGYIVGVSDLLFIVLQSRRD